MIGIVKHLTFCRRSAVRRLISVMIALSGSLMFVEPAVAQEEEPVTDARLEGFTGDVKVENDSTALAWLFVIFLTAVALSPLFKDAKRTHLD